MLRKSDIALLLGLIGFSLALLLLSVLRGGSAAASEAWVRITRDGEEIGWWPLSAEAEFTVPAAGGAEVFEGASSGVRGVNTIVIADGACRVDDADCPDRICVQRGAIARNGETIVCLPHRLVIEVVGGARAEVDAVAQ